MASTKLAYATPTSVTVTGFNSLSSGSFATSDAIDNSSSLYLDYLVEVVVADVVEAGNKQIVVYGISSVDGTNYSDNQSGNPNAMAVVGILPVNGTGSWRSRAFSVAQAFGGVVPPKFKLVIFNDAGVSLSSSGNSVQVVGVYATSV